MGRTAKGAGLSSCDNRSVRYDIVSVASCAGHFPKLTLDDLAGHFDVLLSGHEDEDVTRRKREMDLQDLLDGAVDIVLARRLRVEDLDRESTTRDGEAWCIAIEVGELRCKISLDEYGVSELHTFSAFIVAEVTMSLRSLRRVKTKRDVSFAQILGCKAAYSFVTGPSERRYSGIARELHPK